MSATERHRDQLLTQIAPIVEQLGYELDDVAVTRVGRRSLVKITVDGDHGVDLDAIAELSRAINSALDVDDPFDTPFVLEVSSPGVDRPLTDPKHWRRNVGRMVTCTVDGAQLTARIMSADGAGVVLASDSPQPAVHTVSFGNLGAGRIQVEFGRRTNPADEKD
jgi:ribosome maturation factor RimP